MALLLLAACGDGTDHPGVTRTDSAGVEIVTYGGSDVPLGWTFDSVFALGGGETEEQSFFKLGIGLIRADTAGRIYVLDRAAKHVAVFDSSGASLRAMGRPGGGPGEMEWPASLLVTPDGRAGAFDFGKGALVWFGPEGEIQEQEALPGYSGGGLHAAGSALTLLAQEPGERPGAPTATQLVRVEAGDSTILARRPNTDFKPVEFKSCGISISGMPPVFAPNIRWAAVGDRVAVTTVAEYEIRLFAGSGATHVIRRGLEPEPGTADAAKRELGPGMSIGTSAGRRVCDTDEAVEQLGFADRIPIIVEIAAGPDGTWWVRRHAGGDAVVIDVFAADGGYLGTLPPTAPFPVALLPSARIAAIVTDELDVDRLVIYRLRRNPD